MAHITFIHGISNKPEKNELLRRWKAALARSTTPFDLGASGVSSEMVSWADVLYASPLSDDAFESAVGMESLEIPVNEKILVEKPTSTDSQERAWISALAQRLGVDETNSSLDAQLPQAAPGTLAHELERIPLPGFVKDAFLKRFLRDVHHYLFNTEFSPRSGVKYFVQDEIRKRFVDAVIIGSNKPGPHIVVSHSMGTVIAYDCLKRVVACPRVDALVTIGSPLGIDEVQDKLHPEWTRDDGFPSTKVAGEWLNYYDKGDVVSRLDPYLASDYRQAGQAVVHDIAEHNDGIWRHDIEKYLKGSNVSRGIARLLGVIL